MPTPTTFGRTRRGRSVWPAALAAGVVVPALLGGAVLMVRTEPNAWVLATLVAATTLPIGAALGWALVVDRRTLRGAVAQPEHSAENSWLTEAASAACFDLIAIGGLGATALILAPGLAGISAGAALASLTAIAMADGLVRYLVIMRRAS
ncbi:hypothetical protein [Micropruina sp.]|uniref:hypothetical protein n=1 Tax=Micropruina sp. TaxID=2737536 RepID=UPI0039E4402C